MLNYPEATPTRHLITPTLVRTRFCDLPEAEQKRIMRHIRRVLGRTPRFRRSRVKPTTYT